ncbi:MAG TPA: type II CRISPR-associated endonuclease Cas1 [Candidatus Angelobacter sp.]|nr:type II CRISPR-associated endonuclease Cas1 [Candidatus Angelobacter sp.]
MIDRIIEISNPAKLSVRDAQLVIERPQEEQLSLPFTTPVSEIAVLLLAHPQISLSQAVLSRIAEAGGSVITIDGKFLPASMLLPVQSHFIQTERFAGQMELSLPARKRFWQQIVRAKIKAQGELLRELHGSDQGLIAMSARVRSGDVGNLEAQAARRYWQHLFPGKPFRRGSDEIDQNRHLDYGYTVLRAAVARAICAAGLHPSIGLQHSNRYDPFCLAADVMEPFRPLIDRRVAQWTAREDAAAPLDSRTKNWLIGAVTARYVYEREERTLFDILLRVANSLARCIGAEQRDPDLPGLLEIISVEPAPKRGVKRAEAEELWASKASG